MRKRLGNSFNRKSEHELIKANSESTHFELPL